MNRNVIAMFAARQGAAQRVSIAKLRFLCCKMCNKIAFLVDETSGTEYRVQVV